MRGHPKVDIPASNLKKAIAAVLKNEGYIKDYRLIDDNKQGIIRIYLKYGKRGEKAITYIERVSKPGRRVYRGVDELERVLDGLGISIISTSRGVMSDRECRKLGIGGEVLCKVW